MSRSLKYSKTRVLKKGASLKCTLILLSKEVVRRGVGSGSSRVLRKILASLKKQMWRHMHLIFSIYAGQQQSIHYAYFGSPKYLFHREQHQKELSRYTKIGPHRVFSLTYSFPFNGGGWGNNSERLNTTALLTLKSYQFLTPSEHVISYEREQ